MTSTLYTTEHIVAAELATHAGDFLLEMRAGGLQGEALKEAGDRASHDILVAGLQERFPADAVLSEEGRDDPARLRCRRVWIVDPVDGTREFSERGRDDWAVHVALAVDGTVVAGAVALPSLGVTVSTASPPRPPPVTCRSPRIVVSRTRPPIQAYLLRDYLDGELVAMGSAGAKAMAVARGEADIYAHAGGQYEWDSAAPAAVAAAAGLHVSRLDGSPLVYNQFDPWLPDLLVCRADLAHSIIGLQLK
jgi:3'(2'), 5'-bisphosphate nucleotidase